jgi:hypothetical protein
MFAIGLIYSFLNHFLSASTGGAVIGSIIFARLMNLESNFSLALGGIPIQLLGYYLFIRTLPQSRRIDGSL